jgi:hypothetical protein
MTSARAAASQAHLHDGRTQTDENRTSQIGVDSVEGICGTLGFPRRGSSLT